MGQLVYMVCNTDDVDATTGQCTHVQYVQAPQLIPPLSLADGAAIALPMMTLWALAAVYQRLST